MTRRMVLAGVVLLLAAAGLLPLLAMLEKSLLVGGRLSLVYYREILASGKSWSLLRNSLLLGAWTVVPAAAVGVPLGILLEKTNLPGRRWFMLLFTVPLLVPPYITAVSWVDLLGREGLLARLASPGLAAWTSTRLFGLPGCALVLFSTFLPVIVLLTMGFLGSINPRLEEAGRLVAGWPGVLRGITLPLILPGILLAATLVFLLSLGELGVPMFLRYDVFPVESFTQFSAFLNFGAATAAAVPLALFTLLALGVEWALLREKIQPLRTARAGEAGLQIPLGRAGPAAFLAVALLCFLVVVLPFSALLLKSGSAAAYAEAMARAGDSLVRSLSYAALGASLLTVVGFFAGYLIHTRALAVWRAVDALTLFLFAVPGTVIGIGLVSLWNHPATGFIYGTPAIILLGYVAQYTALASRVTAATLSQIPPSMEEAAQVAGAGWIRRILRIVAPLSARGLVAAWLVSYIFCLRDLGISMLVYPPGHDTFPVRTLTLMANGSAELIAALCVILVVAALLPLAGLGFLFQRGSLPRAVY